jgi:hypothetical protein
MTSYIKGFRTLIVEQSYYGTLECPVFVKIPKGHRLHGWSPKKINDLIGILKVEGPSLIDGILYDTVPELFYKMTYSRPTHDGGWCISFHTAQRTSETPFLTVNDVKIELNKLVDWLASMN